MLIHVLCGISGSGKSTRAKQLLVSYGGFHNAVIINRDKIREQIRNERAEAVCREVRW